MSAFEIIDGERNFKITANILNIRLGDELMVKKEFEFKSSEKLPQDIMNRPFSLWHNGKAKCSNFRIITLNQGNSGSEGRGRCLCPKNCTGLIHDSVCDCDGTE